MGSHASQLNKEERWKLVYYIQKLQGKDPAAEVVVEDPNAENAEEILEPVEEIVTEEPNH